MTRSASEHYPAPIHDACSTLVNQIIGFTFSVHLRKHVLTVDESYICAPSHTVLLLRVICMSILIDPVASCESLTIESYSFAVYSFSNATARFSALKAHQFNIQLEVFPAPLNWSTFSLMYWCEFTYLA